MKTLIGKKIGMTQVFNSKGEAVAVTLISAGPCFITQTKNIAKDGYSALQIGFEETKSVNKPLEGHLKGKKLKHLAEVRLDTDQTELKVGDVLGVDLFKEGDTVDVSGKGKGKGFAGVIKRHNFHRGPETHGSHHHREPGSIGAMFPQHVTKGTKLPGRMGHVQVTAKRLKVVSIDTQKNIIAIKGAVPGANKEIVLIRG